MYISVDKFRTMRTGSDLSDLQDIEIAESLEEASSIVDGYCSVPMLPSPHDFRGGYATDESHRWTIPGMVSHVGDRRAYPFHWPILAIDTFRIYVTNTQYVAIDPSDLYIQPTERYVEVVSLAITSSGLFNALIIPNVGLATPTMRMSYSYGYQIQSDVDERLYPTDALTYRAIHEWWLASPAPVIKRNGTIIDPSLYVVDAAEGTITFDSSVPADEAGSPDKVTATYSYSMPDGVARATGLIAAYLLGEADLVAKGMGGLSMISVAEVRLQRSRAAGSVTAANLDDQIPAAASLLTGYKFWRAG